jgi:hypothetical protein
VVRLGAEIESWRAIAEPMLPPAPVTKMTSFEKESVEGARFAVTGSRSVRSGMTAGECEEDAIVDGDGVGEDCGGGGAGNGYVGGAAAQCGAGGFCVSG